MKKITLILIVAIAVLIFSACSQKEEGAKNPNSSSFSSSQPEKSASQKSQSAGNSSAGNSSNNNMPQTQNGPGDNSELVKKYSYAVLKTSLGDIKVEFDGANAPVTVGNFLKLASSGFYDGTKFHRVIKGFMIQGGDPMSKDESKINQWGTGGPGYKFNDELKGTEKYTQGTLAMANAGPNTNGSQFFIVTADPSYPLPANYTVFGHVVSGMDAALKIENVKTGASDRPLEDVTITSITPQEK